MDLDVMRLIVRGALGLLLHDNADIIDILNDQSRPDLVATINAMETALSWLRKQVETEMGLQSRSNYHITPATPPDNHHETGEHVYHNTWTAPLATGRSKK